MLRKTPNEFSRTFRAQVANTNQDKECFEGGGELSKKMNPHVGK
jgi:hypothetical protein